MLAGTFSKTTSPMKTMTAFKLVRVVFLKSEKTIQNNFPDSSLNMVLLTGGSSGSGSNSLDSTKLLNVDGTVEDCDSPELPEPRENHVTFVTQGASPMVATCGGSTNWKGI